MSKRCFKKFIYEEFMSSSSSINNESYIDPAMQEWVCDNFIRQAKQRFSYGDYKKLSPAEKVCFKQLTYCNSNQMKACWANCQKRPDCTWSLFEQKCNKFNIDPALQEEICDNFIKQEKQRFSYVDYKKLSPQQKDCFRRRIYLNRNQVEACWTKCKKGPDCVWDLFEHECMDLSYKPNIYDRMRGRI
jgi:hypothetical protein